MDNIDFCIKTTKNCTRALMKLSYKNYLNSERLVDSKIKSVNRLYENNNE